ASYWGKFKTTFQMLMIILLILDLGEAFALVETIVVWIALILTVVSLADYLLKNKGVLLEGDI
ncbi:MAG: CDP-diacylglycerol--glycerol-3-phosphate 3-phosphatidyltransferase, partial [Lachnospiraceae bacterium]|nr:CDP-diacylglycerol--glycerol-3-phosphate 3-phosphatidyltransferase [Lachnospiraceae bacterium]